MSTVFNSEVSSSGLNQKKKRSCQKEIASSDSWPIVYQKNTKIHSENESDSTGKDTEPRIITKKTFNYLQQVHKLIPCTHVHSLLKVLNTYLANHHQRKLHQRPRVRRISDSLHLLHSQHQLRESDQRLCGPRACREPGQH